MKMNKIFLAAISVLALSGNAFAGSAFVGQKYLPCQNVAPANKQANPSLKYSITTSPDADMNQICGNGAWAGSGHTYGCSYPLMHDWNHRLTTPWKIYLNNLLTPAERTCTLKYEFAHMPPNNWFDGMAERMPDGSYRGSVWPKTTRLYP